MTSPALTTSAKTPFPNGVTLMDSGAKGLDDSTPAATRLLPFLHELRQ